MPKRHEGPSKNKQTGCYFFYEYVGFPPDRKRVRISLRTKDPARTQWLWEKEYKRQWSKFYGIESPEQPQPVSFAEISEELLNTRGT